MRRFVLLVVAATAFAWLVGCGGNLETRPLTTDEEQRLEEHLREVEEQEHMGIGG